MSKEFNNSTIVRRYNIFPVAPIVVGVVAAPSLIGLFLLHELLFDRYQLFWSATEQVSVLRESDGGKVQQDKVAVGA